MGAGKGQSYKEKGRGAGCEPAVLPAPLIWSTVLGASLPRKRSTALLVCIIHQNGFQQAPAGASGAVLSQNPCLHLGGLGWREPGSCTSFTSNTHSLNRHWPVFPVTHVRVSFSLFVSVTARCPGTPACSCPPHSDHTTDDK